MLALAVSIRSQVLAKATFFPELLIQGCISDKNIGGTKNILYKFSNKNIQKCYFTQHTISQVPEKLYDSLPSSTKFNLRYWWHGQLLQSQFSKSFIFFSSALTACHFLLPFLYLQLAWWKLSVVCNANQMFLLCFIFFPQALFFQL